MANTFWRSPLVTPSHCAHLLLRFASLRFALLCFALPLLLSPARNTLPKDVEDFKSHGVNDVLGKPVKKDALKAYLDKYKLA